MPCYTTPTGSGLVIPNTNNCQQYWNKNEIESINSGDIHSFYDNTLLTGIDRIRPVPANIWVSPKSSESTIMQHSDIIVNKDGTIVTSLTTDDGEKLDIFNSSTSNDINSFSPLVPEQAGDFLGAPFNSGATIVSYSPTGTVLKVAGVGDAGGAVTNSRIIKHSDGGYYLIVELVNTSTFVIFDAGTPDGSGNLSPAPIGHTEINMGGRYSVMIVKYSSEFVAEWMNAVTGNQPLSINDYTVDSSDNLILLIGSELTNNIDLSAPVPPGIGLGSPIISAVATNNSYGVFKFSNEGVPQWFTITDIAGTPTADDKIIPSNILTDSEGSIFVSFRANITGTNILNIYNSAGVEQEPLVPEMSGTFDSSSASYCAMVIKYNYSLVVEWVINNDIQYFSLPEKGIGLLIDKDNSIYVNFNVPTTSPTPPVGDLIINKIFKPPTTAGPFPTNEVIGTIPSATLFFDGVIYETIVKYDSSGEFQWMTIVSAFETTEISKIGKSIILKSGNILSAHTASNYIYEDSVEIYKKSLAPTSAGSYFDLNVADAMPEIMPETDTSVLVLRNPNGDIIWASMYDMTIYMISEDSQGNIYCSGTFSRNVYARIYNANTPGSDLTMAGHIPPTESDHTIKGGLTISLGSSGNVKWVQCIYAEDSIQPDVYINTSTDGVIITLDTGSKNLDSITFGEKITPIGNGEFNSFDLAGTLARSEKTNNYVVSLNNFISKIVHPSYNLMYPSSNNKVITNISTSESIIYGRGLLSNLGVRSYRAVLGPGASIFLMSVSGVGHTDHWNVVGSYGMVTFD